MNPKTKGTAAYIMRRIHDQQAKFVTACMRQDEWAMDFHKKRIDELYIELDRAWQGRTQPAKVTEDNQPTEEL